MDPHKILGVEKDATPAEIKSAYRQKASKYHPDQGGDAWIFQQIQDAYDELTGKKSKPATQPKRQPKPQPKQRTQEDPFEFDVPPNPHPNSSFQNTSWNKPKRKKQSTNWPLIAVGIAVGVAVLIAGTIVVVLLLREPITDKSRTVAENQVESPAVEDVVSDESVSRQVSKATGFQKSGTVEPSRNVRGENKQVEFNGNRGSEFAKPSDKNEAGFVTLFDGTNLSMFRNFKKNKPIKEWKIVGDSLKFDGREKKTFL